MTAASPGFQCNEEIYGAPQDCCCNSIAYALGALCINCQQGTGFEQNGLSEPAEAYTTYLNGCSPVTDGGFTATAQNLVCGSNLKIADELYKVFVSNGSWTYTQVHEEILQSFVTTGNNSFTHCSSTSTNTTASAQPISTNTLNTSTASSISAQLNSTNTPNPTTTSSILNSTNTSILTKHSTLSGGAVGGIVIGTLAILAIAGFIVWLCVRRHRGSAAAIRQITARQMAHTNY
ncbi:hypothetical protein FIBSPDRAFT_146124 [Athelia psychrophila]|uniref:Uncharacterized protein n=1 Tax=Athelia psychrophila TaxID=1759441 RepID=A0A166T4L0_9AGAM|nr:hypothetical protein FIBSPDRAFT_146124 [Fibularhizoctonia sp. CBS 109695]